MNYFVYKYYVANQLVYVGKATGNPYTRFWNHVKKEYHIWLAEFEYVDKIGVISFNNKVDMEICELFLLVTKKPLWNERDIYPHVRPQIKLVNIPIEKIFTIQEFYNEYNNGNNGRIYSEKLLFPENEIQFWKSKAFGRPRPKHPKGLVHLFYSGEELVYISSSAGETGMKKYIEHFEGLSQLGADFTKVTRIVRYEFRTGAETKMYEKYMTAKERPKWCKENPCLSESIEVVLNNIPSPLILCEEEKQVILKDYTNAMMTYRESAERYYARLNKK